jgi:hypothetical protein
VSPHCKNRDKPKFFLAISDDKQNFDRHGISN